MQFESKEAELEFEIKLLNIKAKLFKGQLDIIWKAFLEHRHLQKPSATDISKMEVIYSPTGIPIDKEEKEYAQVHGEKVSEGGPVQEGSRSEDSTHHKEQTQEEGQEGEGRPLTEAMFPDSMCTCAALALAPGGVDSQCPVHGSDPYR